MIELVHKKKGQDAICGSPSRYLVRFNNHVTCWNCLAIIHGKETAKAIVHELASIPELEPKQIDAEKLISRYIIHNHEKMVIETGNFFKGLCLGYDKPSQYIQ